jgi:hypothetical protein
MGDDKKEEELVSTGGFSKNFFHFSHQSTRNRRVET